MLLRDPVGVDNDEYMSGFDKYLLSIVSNLLTAIFNLFKLLSRFLAITLAELSCLQPIKTKTESIANNKMLNIFFINLYPPIMFLFCDIKKFLFIFFNMEIIIKKMEKYYERV